MANFTSSNPSIDAGLAACGQFGNMSRLWTYRAPANNYTTALATCGGVNGVRFLNPIIIPSVGTGVQGFCLTTADVWSGITGNYYVCLEYLLGTITLSGNAFSNGNVLMPTKTILGTALQTASNLAMLTVATAGSASTPTITITYQNQDGVGGQTATLVLPSSFTAGSAFLINPQLANGDSGIQKITGISSSVTTGTLVLNVYGCLILSYSSVAAATAPMGSIEPLITPTFPLYLCAPGEAVNLYRLASVVTYSDQLMSLAFTPEPS